MPLLPGKGQNVISHNIEELHNGPRHKKNAAKFGEKRANKIDQAAAYSNARRSGKRGRG